MSQMALAQKRLRQKRNQNKLVITQRIPRKPTVKSVNRKVKKLQRNTELKLINLTISSTATSDTQASSMILLNACIEGNTPGTRVGKFTEVTSIRARLVIRTTSVNLNDTVFRIIIFRDKQANGAAPQVGDLLDAGGAVPFVQCHYQMDNVPNRFKILHDSSGTLATLQAATTTPASGVVSAVIPVSRYIKIMKSSSFQTNYGASNAGTIADITTNSIFLLLISNNTLASGFAPTVNGQTRVYFKDS